MFDPASGSKYGPGRRLLAYFMVLVSALALLPVAALAHAGGGGARSRSLLQDKPTLAGAHSHRQIHDGGVRARAFLWVGGVGWVVDRLMGGAGGNGGGVGV